MPEIVNGDTDALAAEYVLGTLDFDERSAAQRLCAQDEEFAAKVRVWERRLGELHLMVEPVEPEPEIWQRIRAKLPEVQSPAPVIPVTDIAPEIERKPEVKPELRPELGATVEAQTPLEGKPAAAKPLEPKSAEPELADLEATGQEPAAPPAGPAANEIPIATDAPPAPPEAPSPSSWQPAPSQAPVELPSEMPSEMPSGVPSEGPSEGPSAPSFDISAAAQSAVADALAVPDAPFSGVVPPMLPKVGPDKELRVAQRRLALWRTAAMLLALAVIAVAALVAVWRYIPDRVPPQLRPLELMRLVGITIDTSVPPRRRAPPESRFDE